MGVLFSRIVILLAVHILRQILPLTAATDAVMVEDPDRQRAFKKAAKQLKGKDPSAKLDAIAACSDHTFLIEVKVFLMYLKESSLNS